MRIDHDRGTLLLHPDLGELTRPESLPGVMWDERVSRFRAPGRFLGAIVAALEASGAPLGGSAVTKSEALSGSFRGTFDLRPYQEAALVAWLATRAGLVVLPTGAGKTRVACACIAAAAEATLVVVPTRVLLHQWRKELARWYDGPVGQLGDGVHAVEAITVATYAALWVDAGRTSARFGLVVVDEAHHAALGRLADVLDLIPARSRLGLTATPPNTPEAEAALEHRLGPTVFAISALALAGTALAPWDAFRLPVQLAPLDAFAYGRDYAVFRSAYAAFARTAGPAPRWSDFISACRATAAGREVLRAHERCVERVRYPPEKRALLARLLDRHRHQRTLVFADANATVYAVARDHLVAPITCDIGAAERATLLDEFAAGRITALVSASVLNEGLDVPAAEVAIIVGGRGGGREHVQRVGRVLRPAPGKRAVVYELVVPNTIDDARAARRAEALRRDPSAPAAGVAEVAP
jgi:superfamily II DNA or RNA helicase